jgi:hypothetical protein
LHLTLIALHLTSARALLKPARARELLQIPLACSSPSHFSFFGTTWLRPLGIQETASDQRVVIYQSE